jgi:hypothetical protein
MASTGYRWFPEIFIICRMSLFVIHVDKPLLCFVSIPSSNPHSLFTCTSHLKKLNSKKNLWCWFHCYAYFTQWMLDARHAINCHRLSYEWLHNAIMVWTGTFQTYVWAPDDVYSTSKEMKQCVICWKSQSGSFNIGWNVIQQFASCLEGEKRWVLRWTGRWLVCGVGSWQ